MRHLRKGLGVIGASLPLHTLTVSGATVVHVSDTEASLVELLPLAKRCRPPITGLEQRHAASDWTERGSEEDRREMVRREVPTSVCFSLVYIFQ